MPLKKDILSFIKTQDYEGLEHELKSLKTNQRFLDESLKWACFEGDARSVDMLIKFGANPNYTDEFGTTGLHFAVKGGRQDVVVALLERGAHYLDWEMDGLDLAHWSVRHGFQEVVREMVTHFDLDLTAHDSQGRTALHSACMYGQVSVVEYILGTGLLSVDHRDRNGWTPLHYACSEAGSNFRKMIRVLFRYNADPILLTTNNKTSLDLAYESGRAQQLIDVLTVHKMLQLLISVDNVMVGKLAASGSGGGSGSGSGGGSGSGPKSSDLMEREVERHVTVRYPSLGPPGPGNTQIQAPSSQPPRAPATSTSNIDQRHAVLKLSIWRKVLLNDDVEILQEYRDSGVWYDPDNPISFEQSQDLTKQNFCDIFNDCYENGVGLFSYFNENYRKEISRLDFAGVLGAVSGLGRFPCLAEDDCVLFGSLHESILFLALISGRFKVLETLLKMRQFDIIPVSLLVCLITTRLQLVKNFPPQIIDHLRALAFKAEVIAVDVLNRVYFKDNSPQKTVTLQLINTALSSYGDNSLIDLADLANCSNFLSLPCCQLILDRRWYGNLQPLRSHLKWVIRLIPVTILVYNPYSAPGLDPPRHPPPPPPPPPPKSPSKAAPFIPLLSSSKTDHRRSIKSRLADIKIVSRGGADKTRTRKKVSELEDCERPESSLRRAEVLQAVVNAPGTKFFYHSAAHFLFLVLMSYTMLFDYSRRFQPEEVACYLFVLGYGIEEVRQCVLVSLRCSVIEYLRDKWNWLDMAAISATVLGVCLKVIEARTSEEHVTEYDEVMSRLLYSSRVVLLFALLLFYLRILFIVSISAILGPKLRMIGDMLRKDFLPLLLLFFIFILAFGVLFQGLLYPNGWSFTKPGRGLVHRRVSNQTLEIVGMLLKRAIYGIFEADFPIDETKCDSDDYCVHPTGKTIFLSFSLTVYIVIVYIMLMNLLIALFSNTVARIDQRSTEHWLAGRYKLVEEYKERSIFPPPFNIAERLFDLVHLMVRSLRCCPRSYQEVKPPDSEINIVVKFIIIQSFALKTCRYILGTKHNRDILTAPSPGEKKLEMEIKTIKERVATLDLKIDRILALVDSTSATQSSGPKEGVTPASTSEEHIMRTFSHLRHQELPTRNPSKRNSRISNASSQRPRGDRDPSPLEEKSQEWAENTEGLMNNILDQDGHC